jgi:anti-sigma factor RsiW
MTTAPSPNSPDNPNLLLNAYLDGELDLVTALETERRIAAEPKLAAERDRIQALRSVLRDLWPQETPSPALYARIEQAVGMPAARSRPSWLALAASIALAAILAGATTWIAMNWVRADGMTQAVVAAHVRALMAA